MDYFEYRDGELWAEGVRVKELAERFGTPLYIYSKRTLTRHYHAFDTALGDLDHLTCFSVKANGNVSLLRLLGGLGAGVDIVSGGELHRALKAGIDPRKIVFSGVGKQEHEIREALKADILMFNVESAQELKHIGRIAAEMNTPARISIRINPNVDPKTHPYISTGLKKNKFCQYGYARGRRCLSAGQGNAFCGTGGSGLATSDTSSPKSAPCGKPLEKTAERLCRPA